MKNTIYIRFFGQLTDVVNANELVLQNIADTDAVIAHLTERYPLLSSRKYIIAVDKKQISENTPIADQQTIALMPPFSGG